MLLALSPMLSPPRPATCTAVLLYRYHRLVPSTSTLGLLKGLRRLAEMYCSLVVHGLAIQQLVQSRAKFRLVSAFSTY